MGVKISIDKHVSELDDILEMSPHYLSRVQFESKISPDITQHLKVCPNLNFINFGVCYCSFTRIPLWVCIEIFEFKMKNTYWYIFRFGGSTSPRRVMTW